MAEKKYSHVVALKKAEQEAFLHVEAFPTKDATIEEKEVRGERRKVANVRIVLDNADKKLSYATGVEITANENGVNFLNVSFWGKTAERAMQVVKKGNLISLTGVLKVTEKDGYQNLNFTAEDFSVIRFKDGGKGKSAEKQPETVPPETNTGLNVQDDDLPF